MPKVHFINENLTVEVPRGASLRDVAIQQEIEIYRGMWTHINCLGNGVCGRCKIWITSGPDTISDRSVRERFHRISGTQRLACQVRILGDVEIRTRPIGPAVVRADRADYATVEPSYQEAARVRYQEAKVEAEKKAKEAAEKKAKEAAEKEAQAKAEKKEPSEAAEPKEEAPAEEEKVIVAKQESP